MVQILQMKHSRELTLNKQSNATIVKLFTTNGYKAAPGQEAITDTFVEKALYIGSHASPSLQ